MKLMPRSWFCVVSMVALLGAGGCDCGGSGETDGGGGTDATPGTDSSSTTDGGPPTTDACTGSDAGAPAPGGMLVVNPANPRWLFYTSGAPFFICGPGDPEDFLYRGTRNADGTRNGDQIQLINTLAPTGANSIYFQAVRSHGGDGMSDHNPFAGSNPANPLDSDILDQWEIWLTAMDQAGIVSFFFFYDDSANIWSTGDSVGPEEQAFLEALVNRFEHHELLVWVIAEEYSESFSTARVSNMAAIVRAADDFDHAIAVHQLSGLSFDFPTDPNVDQFAIQHNVSTAAELHDGMVTAFGDAMGAYNLNMSEAAGHGTGAVARRKNWASAMGGAYVMIIGMDIAGTATSDMEDCGRLVDFMELTNFHEMTPRDDLAFADTEYVLAVEGDSYIAYASNAAGDIGLANMTAGTYDFTWLDTVTGTIVAETGIGVASGDQSWSRPAGIGMEVAIWVRRISC